MCYLLQIVSARAACSNLHAYCSPATASPPSHPGVSIPSQHSSPRATWETHAGLEGPWAAHPASRANSSLDCLLTRRRLRVAAWWRRYTKGTRIGTPSRTAAASSALRALRCKPPPGTPPHSTLLDTAMTAPTSTPQASGTSASREITMRCNNATRRRGELRTWTAAASRQAFARRVAVGPLAFCAIDPPCAGVAWGRGKGGGSEPFDVGGRGAPRRPELQLSPFETPQASFNCRWLAGAGFIDKVAE